MLTSDGLTREQFLPLWREAMWHAPNLETKTRLVLEYGRLELRDNQTVAPTVVATVPDSEVPVVLIKLKDVPLALPAEELDALQTRLAKLSSAEVFTVVALQAGNKGGSPSYLLVSWGEGRDTGQACWLQPFRWGERGLEQAEAMMTPDPNATAISKHLAGLIKPRH